MTSQPQGLLGQLRDCRRAGKLTQAALAARSATSRVTIARLETGADDDVRLSTLMRVCAALDLELVAVPRGAVSAQETRLARAHDRQHRLDSRRRHAVLAAYLLGASPRKAAGLLAGARANVDRWQRDRLCSAHYISRWRKMLAGSPAQAARALLREDAWTDALLQNTPWSFALPPSAA